MLSLGSLISQDAFDVRRDTTEPFKDPLHSRLVSTSAVTQWISSSCRDSGTISLSFLIALLLPRVLRELALVGRNTPLGFSFSSTDVNETLPLDRCAFDTLLLLSADSVPVPV